MGLLGTLVSTFAGVAACVMVSSGTSYLSQRLRNYRQQATALAALNDVERLAGLPETRRVS